MKQKRDAYTKDIEIEYLKLIESKIRTVVQTPSFKQSNRLIQPVASYCTHSKIKLELLIFQI